VSLTLNYLTTDLEDSWFIGAGSVS
jgi:hypothetical protein